MKPLAVGLVVAAVCLHLAAYKIQFDNASFLVWNTWDTLPVAATRIIGIVVPILLLAGGISLWKRK